MRHRDSRPLLKTADPRGTLAALYEARVPSYALADVEVASAPGRSLAEMADLVAEKVAERPDVLERT